MQPAAFEARYQTALATSAGLPGRPIGIIDSREWPQTEAIPSFVISVAARHR